ncbi:MAG: UDP-N-acetylmuramoyl-tripeptide--D-alanyl-D-alanine ligase, partial [Clostridiaceae bacterium]|nr:UDP-N-acetylmuramoyl-tripeptide--D-alanyl-D-alanine ligase [Clostridiaceae bacterium]
MERAFTLNELAAACDGLLLGTTGGGQTRIQELCTDSRLDLQDSLFVALVGERLDGHDYLAQAVENGAAALLVHNEILAKQWQTKLPVLLVEDTESALRAIARFYRDSLDLTVVAVTGSVGKTSTRDTIAQALRDQVVVHQTKANLNNMFGVPYTLLDTPLAAEVAVIECGMDHLGEIRDASLAAHPDITIITNIGTSHIENLGSRATILKAKAEILISQKSGGPLVINGEDPYLLQLAQ